MRYWSRCCRVAGPKGGQHLFQERWKIFQFIKENHLVFPIEKMCKVLKVSRSGYYNWLAGKPSKRHLENKEIPSRILSIFNASKQSESQSGLGLRFMAAP